MDMQLFHGVVGKCQLQVVSECNCLRPENGLPRTENDAWEGISYGYSWITKRCLHLQGMLNTTLSTRGCI